MEPFSTAQTHRHPSNSPASIPPPAPEKSANYSFTYFQIAYNKYLQPDLRSAQVLNKIVRNPTLPVIRAYQYLGAAIVLFAHRFLPNPLAQPFVHQGLPLDSFTVSVSHQR